MKSLTEVLAEHYPYYNPETGRDHCKCGLNLSESDDEHAAHVAAVWRETRTVRSVEEWKALPDSAMVRAVDGRYVNPFAVPDRIVKNFLPALVLWLPDEAGA